MTTRPSPADAGPQAGSRRARERPSAVTRSWATPYLYLLPGLAIYGVFMLYPLGRTVTYSFYEWSGFGPSVFVGVDNYAALLTDRAFHAAIWHAVVLIFFYSVLPLVVGLVLAATLRRGQVRGMGFFRALIFLPQVIALVVVAVAWRQIYAPGGGLNALLGLFGVDSDTGWLGEPGLALAAVGVIGFWLETGLVMLLLLAGMTRIPNEMYEAARLDGAGAVREFFAVTLPSVRGEIATALVLTIIAALKTFDLVYMTTRGGPGTATTVPSYEVFNRAFNHKQLGSASAVAVVLTILVFVINVFVSRIGEERSR